MLAERKKGTQPEEAAIEAVRASGRALIITTIILCGSFGLLATSGFRPNAELGILTAVTLGMALIIDFVIFLPTLVLMDSWSLRTRLVYQERRAGIL